jgi:hypothetical protein
MAGSMTPLRQRMLDDMKLRNMAVSTRKIYVASVAGFGAYHGRSPDLLVAARNDAQCDARSRAASGARPVRLEHGVDAGSVRPSAWSVRRTRARGRHVA